MPLLYTVICIIREAAKCHCYILLYAQLRRLLNATVIYCYMHN